jgi:tRNA threonylcarbamoyladenosine biosynthesis protein TsaB
MPAAKHSATQIILAIDTSRNDGSVALARFSPTTFGLIASLPVSGGMFSAQLVPTIARLLDSTNISKQGLTALAVCNGPGSFTGLRIGLAAAKGFAEVAKIPVVAVSSLEVVALAAGFETQGQHLLTLLDAGRSEVYFARFARVANGLKSLRSGLCNLKDVSEPMAGAADAVFTPDASVHSALSALGVTQIEYAGASAVAKIGASKFLGGETTAIESLDAAYLRADDSLFSK